MNRMAETIDRLEERLIRMETKSDDMSDALTELRNEVKAGNQAGQVPNEAGEENIAAQETVKKPQLKEIPFMQVRLAFEEFFNDANEDEWTLMMMAAVGSNQQKRNRRESVYLQVIRNWCEDDIDNLQAYFIANFPQFIKDRIQDKSHYHILTAVGCDLVAYGKFEKHIKDEDVVQTAIGCRVLHSAPMGDCGGCGDAPPENSTLANELTTQPPSVNGTPRKETNQSEKSQQTPGPSNATDDVRNKDTAGPSSGKRTPKKRGKAADKVSPTKQQDTGEPTLDAPIAKRVRRGKPAKKD